MQDKVYAVRVTKRSTGDLILIEGFDNVIDAGNRSIDLDETYHYSDWYRIENKILYRSDFVKWPDVPMNESANVFAIWALTPGGIDVEDIKVGA